MRTIGIFAYHPPGWVEIPVEDMQQYERAEGHRDPQQRDICGEGIPAGLGLGGNDLHDFSQSWPQGAQQAGVISILDVVNSDE